MYYQGTNVGYVIPLGFQRADYRLVSFVPETRKFILQVTDNDRTDNNHLSVWDTRNVQRSATNSSRGQSSP